MSVSARAPSSGQTARSAFRKAAATDTERARGRRKQHKDWPCPVASSWRWQRPGQPFGLPEHGGQQPGTANSLDKSCAMVCHKSRKFLFLRAGAGDGADVLCGGRTGTGQFPHSGGKSPMGWFGERREKRSRRGASPGRQRERTVRVPADRQGCRIGPRRKRRLSRRGCAGRQHAGKGDVLRVCSSEALQSIGMSRTDGSLHTCNDWGPCRRLQKLFPQ